MSEGYNAAKPNARPYTFKCQRESCGKEFTAARPNAKFCCNLCRQRERNRLQRIAMRELYRSMKK